MSDDEDREPTKEERELIARFFREHLSTDEEGTPSLPWGGSCCSPNSQIRCTDDNVMVGDTFNAVNDEFKLVVHTIHSVCHSVLTEIVPPIWFQRYNFLLERHWCGNTEKEKSEAANDDGTYAKNSPGNILMLKFAQELEDHMDEVDCRTDRRNKINVIATHLIARIVNTHFYKFKTQHCISVKNYSEFFLNVLTSIYTLGYISKNMYTANMMTLMEIMVKCLPPWKRGTQKIRAILTGEGLNTDICEEEAQNRYSRHKYKRRMGHICIKILLNFQKFGILLVKKANKTKLSTR